MLARGSHRGGAMATAEVQSTTASALSARPSDEELDLFGITDPGKVRAENQDHFLVCTVHPQVVVHATSLPDVETLPLRGTRLATLLLVADGVGGAVAGNDAARVATESIMRYVSSTLRCYHTVGTTTDAEFLKALQAAALEAHDAVRAEAAVRTGHPKMATTLTVGIAVWPWFYAVQVGDSRCYMYSDGKLRQLTRDQTIGQHLVDEGLLPRERLRSSPFKNVLSSAIGGDEATPEVTRVRVDRGSAVLLCSDGLTKHVSDEEIESHVRAMQSSEQLSRGLLELALSRGGSDNITIVVGRAPIKRRTA
jgi:serine/threonine protein phosphatase PrpC